MSGLIVGAVFNSLKTHSAIPAMGIAPGKSIAITYAVFGNPITTML
jgi:hypothetical protein